MLSTHINPQVKKVIDQNFDMEHTDKREKEFVYKAASAIPELFDQLLVVREALASVYGTALVRLSTYALYDDDYWDYGEVSNGVHLNIEVVDDSKSSWAEKQMTLDSLISDTRLEKDRMEFMGIELYINYTTKNEDF